jgi:hypothetical protein
MKLTVGSRLRSQVCSAQVVIVRGGRGEHELSCGGHSLVPLGVPAFPGLVLERRAEGGVRLGKRYVNEAGDVEVLVTAAGDGELSLDGAPLRIKQPKSLPSSD